MPSPVDTSVKHAISTMTGAPALSGTVGSLIGLLDAVLVNGWGLQTATSVVVASGVATVTFSTAFPATVDSVIQVAGATPSGLNGEQKVVSLGTNIVRFATAEANGTATGTITVRMAGAGWTKAFSGTNLAVYKSADPAAHGGGMYLRVDDTGTTAARVVGYETMTDVNTGLGAFPSNAQVTGGGYWPKSNGANGTAVPWAVVADSRFLLLHVIASTVGTGGSTRGFGDMLALRPSGDAFATVLNYSTSNSDTSAAFDYPNVARFAVPRPFTGLGSSVLGQAFPYTSGTNPSGNNATLGPGPNPHDGGLYLSKLYWATGGSASPRADVPGFLYVPQQVAQGSFAPFQSIPGSGVYTGRNMLSLQPATSFGTAGYLAFIDITGPWR